MNHSLRTIFLGPTTFRNAIAVAGAAAVVLSFGLLVGGPLAFAVGARFALRNKLGRYTLTLMIVGLILTLMQIWALFGPVVQIGQ